MQISLMDDDSKRSDDLCLKAIAIEWLGKLCSKLMMIKSLKEGSDFPPHSQLQKDILGWIQLNALNNQHHQVNI